MKLGSQHKDHNRREALRTYICRGLLCDFEIFVDLCLKLHDGHLSAPPHILLLAASEEREKEDVLAGAGAGAGAGSEHQTIWF